MTPKEAETLIRNPPRETAKAMAAIAEIQNVLTNRGIALGVRRQELPEA